MQNRYKIAKIATKVTYCNSDRLLIIRFLIAIILSESNILHEFDLDLVICESIKSNTAFRIQSILFVTTVMMLNLLFIFFSTVPYIAMNVAYP